MVIVVGSVEGCGETMHDLLEASLEHVRRSRQEDGCMEHTVQIDYENPLRVRFFERWRDLAALTTHFARPESRAFSQKMAVLAAKPPVMSIYLAEEKSLAEILAQVRKSK
jgi:quinol monooxygenase YgiN